MALKNSELKIIDGYYRALNYLSVGQLYLLDNPLLRRPLEISDVKKNIIGHWGTCPGQNLIYAHLNRLIVKNELNMIYLSGPGHGGNAPTSGAYLDGGITEHYSNITEDENGMKELFRRFSFPGGVSSHASPELPGSMHEGGELGYSLSHAFGAVLDNPNLIAACVIGDGEAETGPLACSWNMKHFLNIDSDGVVLPIIHLNGFKINNPTILSRMEPDAILNYFDSMGYYPFYVEGFSTKILHKKLAKVLDKSIDIIKNYKTSGKVFNKINYPVIILKSPKGMTGPKKLVGTSDSHQVPFQVKTQDDLTRLEKWLNSYKPNQLFDEKGSLNSVYKEYIPIKRKTMSCNSHANGGKCLKNLILPNLDKVAYPIKSKGDDKASDMMELGGYLREVFVLNKLNKNFRIFGPDEAMSNRFNKVFEVEKKMWNMDKTDDEVLLSNNGRVLDSLLSEHLCEGALEGYILTGRHGLIHSYEAFVRVIDSMAGQHAKWLKMCSEIQWRKDISSLNFLLSSHAWQQDHNGYTHQEPGFISHILTKKKDFTGVYLPVDANTLIVSVDDALKSRNKVNAIVASKHIRNQWFTMNESIDLLKKGLDIISWASNDNGKPDIVLVSAGDTPADEIFIASKILSEKMPNLKVRVINVLNLMKLCSPDECSQGISNDEFDSLFTKDKPVIFSFHGYTSLIKSLLYERTNKNIIFLGYNEEGTITTPFDMKVLNKIDRYNIILEVLKNVKKSNNKLKEECESILLEHHDYIRKTGLDLDLVTNYIYNTIDSDKVNNDVKSDKNINNESKDDVINKVKKKDNIKSKNNKLKEEKESKNV